MNPINTINLSREMQSIFHWDSINRVVSMTQLLNDLSYGMFIIQSGRMKIDPDEIVHKFTFHRVND